MSADVTAVARCADNFDRLCTRVWTVQTELSRIGRLFRDRWAPALTVLAAKAGTGTASPAELASLGNYRGTGKSAGDLQTMATALWMIHNLIDPDPPDPDSMDASKTILDVANIVTDWVDTAYSGTGNPLNEDIYKVCMEMSRIGHDVWNAMQLYSIRVEPIIAKFADDAREPYTERTGKQWRDCAEALNAYWPPFFRGLSPRGFGYGTALLAF